MLHLIICEDDMKFRNSIVRFLESLILNNHIDAAIGLVTDDPMEVLEYANENADKSKVFFLDIDLGTNTNGLLLAKEIRKQDYSSYIVFISSFQEYSIKTFQYKLRVSDFIYKGEKDLLERLRDSMDMVQQEYRASKNFIKTITIKSGQTLHKLSLEDIISFQTSPNEHKIVVSTFNNQIEFYGAMKELEEELDKSFFRIHRSFIINIKHIIEINKNREDMHVLMKDGSKCLLSRNYLKGLVDYVENHSHNS